jgi:phosphatidylglycerophosphate synthase
VLVAGRGHPQDARAAAAALRRSLGKPTDGPVSRLLNRPLSTRLSMTLAPLRPAPDLVSLVAFALGLADGALLAASRGLAGALLVHAASVADGVDGEVARLQLRGGPRGALLDGVLDRVADAAILAGLGLWALDGHDARVVLALTVAATAGALLSMATKDRATALGLPPAPERKLGWLLGGRDGRLLIVAVAALLGSPVAALAAATATSALPLGLRVAFLRRPRPPNDPGAAAPATVLARRQGRAALFRSTCLASASEVVPRCHLVRVGLRPGWSERRRCPCWTTASTMCCTNCEGCGSVRAAPEVVELVRHCCIGGDCVQAARLPL